MESRGVVTETETTTTTRTGTICRRFPDRRYYFIRAEDDEQIFAHLNDMKRPGGHSCLFTTGMPVTYEFSIDSGARPRALNVQIDESRIRLELPEVETSTVYSWDVVSGFGFLQRFCGCRIFCGEKVFKEPPDFTKMGGLRIRHHIWTKNNGKCHAVMAEVIYAE